MYYKEAREAVKALDMAHSYLSRAQAVIKRSEALTSADKELYNSIFEKSKDVRDLRNMVKIMYSGMNE